MSNSAQASRMAVLESARTGMDAAGMQFLMIAGTTDGGFTAATNIALDNLVGMFIGMALGQPLLGRAILDAAAGVAAELHTHYLETQQAAMHESSGEG